MDNDCVAKTVLLTEGFTGKVDVEKRLKISE